MKYGIYVGISDEAITAYGETILTILNSKADQSTIRVAIKALQRGLPAPNNSTISNVTINSDAGMEDDR